MVKTFYRFFTIADYEDEEVWLREQHRNGWKIIDFIPPFIYKFESCEPEDVIYRLDYKNNTQTDEYFRMLGDFGWEYVGKCFGWLYFRKPALGAESAEDGELFSDNESRLEMVTKVVKTRLFPLLIIFLCCVIPNLLNAMNGLYGGHTEMFFTAFFGIMFVVYAALIVYCGLKLKRIREKYEK